MITGSSCYLLHATQPLILKDVAICLSSTLSVYCQVPCGATATFGGGGWTEMSDRPSVAEGVLPACCLLPPSLLINGHRESQFILQGGDQPRLEEWTQNKKSLGEGRGMCYMKWPLPLNALQQLPLYFIPPLKQWGVNEGCLRRSLNAPQRNIQYILIQLFMQYESVYLLGPLLSIISGKMYTKAA